MLCPIHLFRHCIPVQSSRTFLANLKALIPPGTPIISTSKGLDVATLDMCYCLGLDFDRHRSHECLTSMPLPTQAECHAQVRKWPWWPFACMLTGALRCYSESNGFFPLPLSFLYFRMSSVIPSALGRDQPRCFLSGPSFAKELLDKTPTGVRQL